MNMIGHDHERINLNAGVMVWHFVPRRLNHPPDLIHDRLAVANLAEETLTVLGADGDEIRVGRNRTRAGGSNDDGVYPGRTDSWPSSCRGERPFTPTSGLASRPPGGTAPLARPESDAPLTY
jgi:hypothetical protein